MQKVQVLKQFLIILQFSQTLVWNTTDVDWNLEESNWATDTVAPAAPAWSDFITTNDPQPNVNGTAEADSTIDICN